METLKYQILTNLHRHTLLHYRSFNKQTKAEETNSISKGNREASS